MVPPDGRAYTMAETTKAASAAASNRLFFISRFLPVRDSLSESPDLKRLPDSGTRWRAVWLCGRHECRTFLCRFPHGQFGALARHLQGAQVMHQVPGLVWFDHVRERRHGRAVQSGVKDLVEI